MNRFSSTYCGVMLLLMLSWCLYRVLITVYSKIYLKVMLVWHEVKVRGFKHLLLSFVNRAFHTAFCTSVVESIMGNIVFAYFQIIFYIWFTSCPSKPYESFVLDQIWLDFKLYKRVEILYVLGKHCCSLLLLFSSFKKNTVYAWMCCNHGQLYC